MAEGSLADTASYLRSESRQRFPDLVTVAIWRAHSWSTSSAPTGLPSFSTRLVVGLHRHRRRVDFVAVGLRGLNVDMPDPLCQPSSRAPATLRDRNLAGVVVSRNPGMSSPRTRELAATSKRVLPGGEGGVVGVIRPVEDVVGRARGTALEARSTRDTSAASSWLASSHANDASRPARTRAGDGRVGAV